MNDSVILMIFGMAIVTYLPRMLPLVVLNGKKMNPLLQGILKNVPYAALGALIVPGIFMVNTEDMWFGIIGAIVAFTTAFLGANVMIVVLASIGALSIYSYFL